MGAQTILLYGRSRGGKTSLLGELAEDIYKRTGKTTRLYTADKGGADPVAPYVELGIVQPIEIGSTDPWIFLQQASKGAVREGGKWVASDLSNVGAVCYEGLTSMADCLMVDLAERSAKGESFGGAANVSFRVEGDGEVLKIGGANMAHYNIVQSRITSEVWKSQTLPVDYIVWTANVSKDDDGAAAGKVLGPEVVGKKLTSEVPRWFKLTFRVDCLPAQAPKPERHILFLGNSQDLLYGNATSLGNTRTPLDSKPLPPSIEPASLVQALRMIDSSKAEALNIIKARLAAKNKV